MDEIPADVVVTVNHLCSRSGAALRRASRDRRMWCWGDGNQRGGYQTINQRPEHGSGELDAELGSVTAVLESAGADDRVIDADISVVLLNGAGKVRSDVDIVFYNQPVGLHGAVRLRDKIRPQPHVDASTAFSQM